MKTTKILPALLVVLTGFVGCKNNNETTYDDTLKADENVGLIEDQSGIEEPNKSDVAFGEALSAYSNKDYQKAGTFLTTGEKELAKEAKTKGSVFNDELNTSLKHLTDIAKEVQNGQKIDEKALRTMIANAEINVNHPYLASDDIYMLTEPEKVNDYRFSNTLDSNLNSLEAGSKKLEGDAKKVGEKLDAEGKKLKEELAAWNDRAEKHNVKTQEHFKKHQPEYALVMYPVKS